MMAVEVDYVSLFQWPDLGQQALEFRGQALDMP